MSDTAPEVTAKFNFYASWICPFVHRVWISLLEKQIPFNWVEIDLSNKPSWYPSVNPAGKVPVIGFKDEDGTHLVNESLTLLEFLEDYQPSPALHPASPVARAHARNIISFFGDEIIGHFYKTLRGQEKEDFQAAAKDLSAALIKLESKMSPEGPYFLGKEFSIVDAAILPWLVRGVVIKHYRGWDMLEGVPKLKASVEKCMERESVKQSMVVPHGGVWADELMKAYKAYGGKPVQHSSPDE